MNREEIFEKFRNILENNYEINSFEMNERSTIFEDIGLASLEFMNFILDVEKEFSVVYNFEMDINTIGDLIDFIVYKQNISDS